MGSSLTVLAAVSALLANSCRFIHCATVLLVLFKLVLLGLFKLVLMVLCVVLLVLLVLFVVLLARLVKEKVRVSPFAPPIQWPSLAVLVNFRCQRQRIVVGSRRGTPK